MTSHHQPGHMDKIGVIHQQYMSILNGVMDAVYWTDVNCNLIGCNNSFLKLMGIENHRDIKGSPYLLMKNHAHWSDKRIEAFKLDDMNVIFSETPRWNVEEHAITNDKNKTFYFKSNRVLMFNEQKKICGLIVVLSDITALKEAQEAQKMQQKQQARTNEPAVIPHRLPTVLMIEDNLIAQNVERALLKALNCEVDLADTGIRQCNYLILVSMI